MIPVICMIILPLNSRPEKKLDRKCWKLGRVTYLAQKLTLTKTKFTDQLETSTTHLVCYTAVFSAVMQQLCSRLQPTGHLTITRAGEGA